MMGGAHGQPLELKSPMSFIKQGKRILAGRQNEGYDNMATLMTPVNQSLAVSG